MSLEVIDVVDKVRALLPDVRKLAERTEQERNISPEIMAALVATASPVNASPIPIATVP